MILPGLVGLVSCNQPDTPIKLKDRAHNTVTYNDGELELESQSINGEGTWTCPNIKLSTNYISYITKRLGKLW